MKKQIIEIVSISIPIWISYLWVSHPYTKDYALQAFVASVLAYSLLKMINKKRIVKILADTALDEMIFISFSFLILIGSSDGLDSIFFPLIYIYLFFLIIFTHTGTALVISAELLAFFYLLLSQDISLKNASGLISIVIITFSYIFAKKQYDRAEHNQYVMQQSQKEIETYKQYIEKQGELISNYNVNNANQFISFIDKFLKPHIFQLQKLSSNYENRLILQSQLTKLSFQLDQISKKLQQKN